MGADCKYCGAYISGDQPKCPACGRRLSPFGSNKNSGEFSDLRSSGAATQTASQEDWDRQEKARQAQWFETQRKSQEDAFDRQRERQSQSSDRQKSSDKQWKETLRKEREKIKTECNAKTGETKDADSGTARKNSLSYLCYIGILFFIPLIADPKDEFIRYHCNQGLALFFTFVIAWITSWWVIWVFAVFCLIKGLSNVSRGVMQQLPIIGKFKFIK